MLKVHGGVVGWVWPSCASDCDMFWEWVNSVEYACTHTAPTLADDHTQPITAITECATMPVYCEITVTITVVNVSVISHSYLFIAARTLTIDHLSRLQLYSISYSHKWLYTRSQKCNHLTNDAWCPWIGISPSSSFPSPWQPHLLPSLSLAS